MRRETTLGEPTRRRILAALSFVLGAVLSLIDVTDADTLARSTPNGLGHGPLSPA